MYRIAVSKPPQNSQQVVVTIGNFDGLHIGHKQLFTALNNVAAANNYRRIAITFEPLPLEYFFDQKKQQRLHRLCLLRDKFFLLKQHNLIDELVVLHFNASIANLTPAEFIHDILINKLNTKHAVIGHDFKFGCNGSGNITDLVNNGIECTAIAPYMIGQNRISSSIIREMARNNQLDLVREYLGRNLHYTARVIHGNKMGRKFGVPTINLSVGRNRLALWGIYIAVVHIEGCSYNAVASIGKNPTTNAIDVFKLEAHLLGVDLDLYGKIATVEILQFIREERKFDTLESLFAQIHDDMAQAKNYFNLGQ